MKKKILISLIIILSCSLFTPSLNALSEKGYRQLHTFTEVLRQIEENYVEPVNERRVITGAIRGMLMTLDPHTVYLPPEVYKELKVEAAGRFGGIGIEVTMKKSWLTVVAPIEGTPAYKAGIKAGDRIVRVNGVSTKGVSLGEAVTMMRGRVGTRITLTIVRDKKKPRDIGLVRKVIKVPSVYANDIGDGVYYMRISTFQDRTSDEFKEELKKFSRKGDITGLVIDLRNNPGGLLGEAIALSDLFLDKGIIVSTRSRDKEIAKYVATEAKSQPAYPIVILVNGGTASASEILAGALSDHNRAILLGTQTFGKGSVQSVFELDDGSAVKITIAKYYTPSGHSIQGMGIQPQVIVELDEESEEGKLIPEIDSQKAAAISYVKDKSKYKRALRRRRKHHR